jgi:hypothetical protein
MSYVTKIESIYIPVGDESSPLTASLRKAVFRMPYDFILTKVKASLSSAPTGGTTSIDITQNSSSIFSTLLTINDGETTSNTAAIPAVLSVTELFDDDEISVDINIVAPLDKGTGLKIWLIGYKK